ncbi:MULTISPECIES: type III-B CRISPR-associated protein Cas10/Cmr2 [Clostridia]|uniref:type III-B CRISPR-associated protein Cas10/Cmr2 n=1 Tax=Clostridia TaxID=186801 RepID=UPI00067EA91C|nr:MULTISPECIES: type III-B CRISPR-associated protein Cas10/Cmr2 [Clostridia]
MRHLLLFTIGPVQPLIVNSRKVSDMFAGSRLLSSLMQDALQILEHQQEVRILFPFIEKGEGNCPNIPNKLIAELNLTEGKSPEEIATFLELYIKKQFFTVCMGYLNDVGIMETEEGSAARQLRDFLEVFWIAEEYESQPYSEVYQKLFRKMNLVKSIRTFSQNQEPWNRKCALFPQYNAIYAKCGKSAGVRQYPANINPTDVYDISEVPKLTYAVKPKEALSAIAMVKRSYGRILGMYSLRQMLLRHQIGKIKNGKQILVDLENRAGGKTVSSTGDQIANAVYDYGHGNPPDYEEYDKDAWEYAVQLYHTIQEEDISLSDYYAMLKFDGDNMGEIFLNKHTVKEQQELSRSISDFASEIPNVLKEFNGLLVYAGGEDFLGFLPLDTLLACLDKLQKLFQERVKLTFSAGIVIAHLMQPLKMVALAAEEMEMKAKQAEGKDAFVLGILKRSGERVVSPPYKFDDYSGCAYPKMTDLRRLLETICKNECPRALLNNIITLFRCFLKEDVRPEKARAEILLRESVSVSKAQDADELADCLVLFYEREESLDAFLDTLNAVLFLAREVGSCII